MEPVAAAEPPPKPTNSADAAGGGENTQHIGKSIERTMRGSTPTAQGVWRAAQAAERDTPVVAAVHSGLDRTVCVQSNA